MKFIACKVCRNPYPILVENTAETQCPPCRKRRIGEVLTKSDIAFDEIHGHYRKIETLREEGWRNRLGGLEAEVRILSKQLAANEEEIKRTAAMKGYRTVNMEERNSGLHPDPFDPFSRKKATPPSASPGETFTPNDRLDTLERLMEENADLRRKLEAVEDTTRRRDADTELLRRQARTEAADRIRINAALFTANTRIATLERELSQLRFSSAFRAPTPGLDREFLGELVKLCHPDKHGGSSDIANKVTARLLNLRKEAK